MKECFLPASLGDHHLGAELVELLPQLFRLKRHLKLFSVKSQQWIVFAFFTHDK